MTTPPSNERILEDKVDEKIMKSCESLEISHRIYNDLLRNLSRELKLREIDKLKGRYCARYNSKIQLQTFSLG